MFEFILLHESAELFFLYVTLYPMIIPFRPSMGISSHSRNISVALRKCPLTLAGTSEGAAMKTRAWDYLKTQYLIHSSSKHIQASSRSIQIYARIATYFMFSDDNLLNQRELTNYIDLTVETRHRKHLYTKFNWASNVVRRRIDSTMPNLKLLRNKPLRIPTSIIWSSH